MAGTGPQPADTTGQAAGPDLTFPRILIVDDDVSLRRVCAFALRHDGWRPEGEASSRTALQRLAAGEHFDVIVLDYAMPELNGLEFLRELNGRMDGSRPAVLLASAHADGAVAYEALSLGVWDFLAKPFTPEELRCGVRRLLKRPAEAEEGDARARALSCAVRRDWAEARRMLDPAAGESRNDLLAGLLAQVAGDVATATRTFSRCNWSQDWNHEGSEIWSELSRRFDV